MLTEELQAEITACPHCHEQIDPMWIKSASGKLITRQRKSFGGRARVPRNCPWCKEEFHSQALRTHLSKCPMKDKEAGKKRGRPKKKRECEWCKRNYGYSDLQVHKTKCPKRPKPVRVTKKKVANDAVMDQR